ncbi:MAG: toprim domain-containing protein [Proteobacteria bacterium]|nr:toprim domain-containing protein [Pseudomonadota bacterium]NBP15123.1 toprim domain-containing protein [bacterium]
MNLQNLKSELNLNIESVLKKLDMDYEKFSDNIYSNCPAHEESDNPRGFSFSTKKCIWKCWTRDCQNDFSNDVFGLIRGALSKKYGYNVDFKEVLKWINANIKQLDNKKVKQHKKENVEESEFFDIVRIFSPKVSQSNESVVDYEYTKPSKYFISRGFLPSTLEYFGVSDRCNHDALKDRAIIPIHNSDGSSVVGLLGRSIKEYKDPKFLFYPSGFNKNQYVYNYHRAYNEICKTKTVIITEGQSDIWRLYEAGIENVIGIFGKSIIENHEEILHKLPIINIIVATDNDQAGNECKIEIFRKLNRSYNLVFPKITNKDIGEMSVELIKRDFIPQIKGLI